MEENYPKEDKTKPEVSKQTEVFYSTLTENSTILVQIEQFVEILKSKKG